MWWRCKRLVDVIPADSANDRPLVYSSVNECDTSRVFYPHEMFVFRTG